ncbi:MAG: EAL domain-containing protein [Xanthobacteraceae bacterium]|nr:EAL domain-containing protein [Xanthobacteraceae bacterium]
MYRLLACLTVQHDYRLVALAVLICVVGALVSFKIYSQVASSERPRRWCLLALTGICSGAGIWATHFIAMLAYDAGLPIAYEPVATAASFVIAVSATTLGFGIAANGLRWQPYLGGVCIGVGIGLMHYAGMHALILPGTLEWDTGMVAASVTIGFTFAAGAIIAFHRWTGRRAIWTAAGLFAVAICGLHFTAMAAATAVPDPTNAVPPFPIDASLMVFAVSGAALVIMLSGIASTAIMESQMRRQREEELRIQNLRFDTALDHMREALCMFDAEKRLVVCNGRYAEMYRLPPELVNPGTPHREIIRHCVVNGVLKGDADDGAAERVIAALSALPADSPSSRIDEFSDGRLICITRQPTAGGGWVATHVDVTERQHTEAKIAYMAQHDSLTDLPNRTLFRERLEQALARARKRNHRSALLMLDLDRFKEINDTFGHPVGDALLKIVAERLRKCCRETSTIARLGGDEFAVIEDVADDAKDSATEAAALAERIQCALGAPYAVGGYRLVSGASIGIAIMPDDGTTSDEIVKNADLALYRAKEVGRGSHRLFEPEMDRHMRARHALEQQLRNALVGGEFELHYQPFSDVCSGETAGYEALLRWNHPTRGLVMPGEFISLAEETGLIVPIGEWVLMMACAEAAKWPSHCKISINISPAQFKSTELVPTVVSALGMSDLAPHRLELEVTETAIMHDSASVFDVLRQLHGLGVRIALDDFGTGYSSLSFLQRFPFDKVKIDRSFINELFSQQSESRTIARAVVRFAVSLGKTTTAEGVETKEQAEFLRAEGCGEMQGYYLGRPMPSAEFAQFARPRLTVAATAA